MAEVLPLQRPYTPDDMAAAVRAAAAAGAQVRIAGGDSLPLTRFDPARPLRLLSTLRMNKIVHHAVGDMTVCVQAGLSLEALQRQLAWHDQWLPVDPPVIARTGRTPGGRTIGGMIASNSLGPLRFGLAGGDWRRLILGMRWIDATGTLIKGGGQTVKNVAGYSSPRMLIGSAGTLGIIAEVTLRTFARPGEERCIVFFCHSPAQAEALLAAILVSPTTPDYLQLIGGGTWAHNPLGLPSPAESPGTGGGEGGSMVLAAGFLGRPETCAAQLDILRALDAARGIESIAQTAAQAGRLRLWMTTEPALATEEDGIGFRLHAKSSEAAALVAQITYVPHAANSWVVSEAAAGIIRAVVPGPGGLRLVDDLTGTHGTNLIITQGRFPPLAPHPLAQRVKRALDPNNVFGNLAP